MSSFFARVVKNRHIQHGGPFFLFIFGGAFVLREFRTVRYDSELNPKARNLIKPEEAFADLEQKAGGKVKFNKNKVSLEKDLELLEQKVDLDSWEQVRGPRPWEEGSIKPRPVRRFPHSAPTVEELTTSR